MCNCFNVKELRPTLLLFVDVVNYPVPLCFVFLCIIGRHDDRMLDAGDDGHDHLSGR